jgi:hypothetical protein
VECEVFRLNHEFYRNFRLVSRWPRALDFLMAPDSGEGAIRTHELTFAAQITLTQNELNQFAHGDGMDWF